ncbi:MAG: sensor histidine kinase [Ferruginibacter sp.]
MGKTTLIIFIVLAGIIFMVFVAGLFLFVFQYRKRKIMYENEKQLLALNSILQGQQEERSRLAKDLHDGLGGMLSGIKLNLSSMKGNIVINEKDALLFNKSLLQLDNAIAEMRRVAHNMMPEALLKFGISDAIRDFCDGINESNSVKMKYQGINFTEPLEKSTEVILYRMVQELSNNAIKHAHANTIFIQIAQHELGITLTVEDDGKGFNMNDGNIKNGNGFKNIQSRVDYLKGSWDIKSEPGKGTSINIEIPVYDER